MKQPDAAQATLLCDLRDDLAVEAGNLDVLEAATLLDDSRLVARPEFVG
jgi:hypothetical protein